MASAHALRAQSTAFVDSEATPGPLRQVAPVMSAHAMIVTANAHASQAGLEMLQAGGTAADAAAAAAFALNVVEPQSSGIGGGAFVLVFSAVPGSVESIDGREEAPSSATPDLFMTAGGRPQPFYPDRITGGRAVGVPGLVRALEKLLQRHGRLGMARVLLPAIRLAEDGFAVSPRLATMLRYQRERLARFPATRSVFFDAQGQPLREGARLRQPDLARTLRLIAEGGANAFYQGALADDLLGAVNNTPINAGRMSAADLAAYQAPLRAPVVGRFHGWTIYGMGPPSSGGVTVQQMLNLLEKRPAPQANAQRVHRFAQAARLAYADRERYLGDADFVAVPLAGLLDPAYLAVRAGALDWESPLAPVRAGNPARAERPEDKPSAREDRPPFWDSEFPATTHLVVVDEGRNVVALTASIEAPFGSAVVVPGRGFLLNNELTDFDVAPEQEGRLAANRVQGERLPRRTALDVAQSRGGKRPRSSMAPTLVFRGAPGHLQPALALGSPGGPRFIQYVAWVLLKVLEQGEELQPAISAPLATHLRDVTVIEPEWDDPGLEPALRKLGHQVQIARQGSGLHGIRIDAAGRLHSGVDPRREGQALGY